MSRRPDNYLTDMFAYYSELGEVAMRRWRKATREIGKRRYTPTKLISDVLASWIDGTRSVWEAWGATGGLRHILFVIDQRTEADRKKVVPMYVPGSVEPELTELIATLDSSNLPCDKVLRAGEDVCVKTNGPRDCLTVALVGLSELPAKGKLASGVYEGLVHVEEKPLAVVHIVVERVWEKAPQNDADAPSS